MVMKEVTVKWVSSRRTLFLKKALIIISIYFVDLNPCRGNPCLNGATCYNDNHGGYTCACASGYQGRNCSVQCESDSCRENGTCIVS